MKKLIASLLMVAAVGLTACEASASSATIKANLDGAGYSCEIMSKEEAEKRIVGVEYVVSIKDAVYAIKGSSDVFIGFFCNNIEDASNFMTTNVSVLYHFAEQYTESPKVGSHNNVAYVGTPASIAASRLLP